MKVDDEDERIRRAVEEAEARQAKEDAERTERARRMMQEASDHRITMVRTIASLNNGVEVFTGNCHNSPLTKIDQRRRNPSSKRTES